MTREELSTQVIEAIHDNCNVALQMGTGVGKSKMAIDVLNYLSDNKANLEVLVVVAERAHIDNWRKEFKKWHYDDRYVTIKCYQSLHHCVGHAWAIVIFDEAHHLNTPKRLSILEELVTARVLLLSATLKRSFLDVLTNQYIGPIQTVKCSLQDAIDDGILKEPEINIIKLELDRKNVDQTIIDGWGKKTKTIECRYKDRWTYLKRQKAYPDTKLIIHCTQYEKYCYLTNNYEYWKARYMRSRNETFKFKWLQAGSIRKRFLGELKTDYVKLLLDKIGNKRLICFCTSIEQAEILGGKNSIHHKKADNAQLIERFNRGKISNLFAVNMLKEGMNLNNIEVGIIIQLDGEELPFVQKFGRTMRADNPIQYILYFKDTRDEEYLAKAMEGINKDYIKVYDIHN